MRGPWAGEVGQFQFVPSVYYKYAVDFDGDGRRNLIQQHA
jgi:membrane-bound lytic murein transglycosylase B